MADDASAILAMAAAAEIASLSWVTAFVLSIVPQPAGGSGGASVSWRAQVRGADYGASVAAADASGIPDAIQSALLHADLVLGQLGPDVPDLKTLVQTKQGGQPLPVEKVPLGVAVVAQQTVTAL